MAHRRARLTPFGRLLLVSRILEDGWSVQAAAGSVGVSRATAHKWLKRFREEGLEGLEDRSSAPHRRPRSLAARDVERILRARRRLKVGPHRLGPELGHPRSTVYGVLRRHGVSRLAHLDRPTAAPVRFERERPGELVHVDVKKLSRGSGRAAGGGSWASAPRRKVHGEADLVTTTSTLRSTTAPATPTSRSLAMNAERHARGSCSGPPPTSPSAGSGPSGYSPTER